MDELPRINEFLIDTLEGVWFNPARHPVIRSGEREPIPAHVRSAVWYRDEGRCAHCATGLPVEYQPWHLDHITPWSAGGADDSTNLRVLCERHNMARGNAVDPFARPARPVTWWCENCFGTIPEYDDEGYPVDPERKWLWVDGVPVGCPIHWTNNHRCRVISAYRRHWERTQEQLYRWHQRDAIDTPTVVAYCAHCDAYALTDMPL